MIKARHGHEADAIRELGMRLLAWYGQNKRALPWRRSYLPYEVWITEMMGQQTQVTRVAGYFTRWLRLFPNVEALASASEQSVLKAWEGLGYYSRARNLRRAARIIMAEHGGKIPANERELLALPGIGPYTAAALLSLGFEQPVPLVDANVFRVMARLFDFEESSASAAGKERARELALRFLAHGNPRATNEAWMEFGELVCMPRNPACSACPLRQHCLSWQRGTVALRPVLAKRPKRSELLMACGILCQNGRVYTQKRRADKLWGGLWEFPSARLESGESPEEAALRAVRQQCGQKCASAVRLGAPLSTVVHHYTHYRVTLHGFFCHLPEDRRFEPLLSAAPQYAWVELETLRTYPFPAGHRMLVEILLREMAAAKGRG